MDPTKPSEDITDTTAVLEEVRERERFLVTLMSNLPGMVYRCRNDPSWTWSS